MDPAAITSQSVRQSAVITVWEFASRQWGELAVWLLAHPPERLHWEWEAFHYFLCWGLVTNMLFFIALSSPVAGFSWWFLAALAFMVYAVARSLSFGTFHYWCLNKIKDQRLGDSRALRGHPPVPTSAANPE